MRHAAAVTFGPAGMKDRDRPLTPQGRGQAPTMAARIRSLGRLPQVVVSSPALRALETAQVVAENLGLDRSTLITEPGIYEAGVGDIMDALAGLEDRFRHVLLVGHNPGISEVADVLSRGGVGTLPPGGLAAIHLRVASWAELPRQGRLLTVEHP